MSARFCSLDISTKKTGICLLIDGELSEYDLLDYSKITDKQQRMHEMGVAIINKLDEYNPDVIYVEDSWNARNIETTKMLTLLMGVSFCWALQHNVEWNAILPSQWRKYAGINQGKKKRAELKQASIDYVKEKYNIEVNDDVADSITLADAVCNYFNSLELFE